jgi:hypothetical protein
MCYHSIIFLGFPSCRKENPEVTTNQLLDWKLALPIQRGLSLTSFSISTVARSSDKDGVYKIGGRVRRE